MFESVGAFGDRGEGGSSWNHRGAHSTLRWGSHPTACVMDVKKEDQTRIGVLMLLFFRFLYVVFYTKEERKTERQEIPVHNSSFCMCVYEYA